MGKLAGYILIMNISGFLSYLLKLWYASRKSGKQSDKAVMAVAMAGGSIGVLLAVFLVDRKAKKENMMVRVFAICVLIIQTIVLLMIRGYRADTLSFAIWKPFIGNRILWIYLAAINFISFAVYAIDKVNAAAGKRRIRIITLLGLACLGGSVGALLAMYLLRHKTKKNYFTSGILLIMLTHLVLLFYFVNFG